MRQQFRVYLVLTAAVLSMGNLIQCDRRVPTIECGEDIPLEVEPPSCVLITNPCGDGEWLTFPRVDGFSLNNPPNGMTVVTSRSGLTTSREVCARDNVFADNLPVSFQYGRGNEIGRGTYRVSTPVFAVTLTAEPLGGGQYRLHETVVHARGAVTIEWIEVGDPNGGSFVPYIDDVIVQPLRTTTYRVRVINARFGMEATADVTIDVGLTVTLVATPATIDSGQSVILGAHVSGGSPPYTFAWDPIESVAYEGGPTAVAAPRTTTTYTVAVTDTSGATASARALVTVRPAAAGLTADFAFTYQWGDPVFLFLDASTSTGDIVRYAWDFSWHTFNPPLASSHPLYTLIIPQGFGETITLTVTHRNGTTARVTKGFPF